MKFASHRVQTHSPSRVSLSLPFRPRAGRRCQSPSRAARVSRAVSAPASPSGAGSHRSGRKGGLLIVAVALALLSLPAGTHAIQPLGYTESSPPTLRVGAVATTACQGTVDVPIFARNHDIADGVEIAIDYDTAVLGYAWPGTPDPRWKLDRATQYGKGRVIFSMRRVPGTKPTDPAIGVPEAKLLNVIFYLKDDVCKPDAPFQVVGPVGLGVTDSLGNASDSYFVSTGSGDALRPIPTRIEPGRVTVYTRDGLEVGWGAVTRAPQTFALPLYLTITDPTERLFLVGVDYDELFLNLRQVTPRGPASEERTRDSLRIRGEGSFGFELELELEPDYAGEICHLHVADLVFRYNGATPPAGDLRVQPRLLRHAAVPGADGPVDLAGAGGVYGEAVPGVVRILPPRFVRGNIDSSASTAPSGEIRHTPDLFDAQAILRALFQGSTAIPCLDAADVNDDGTVELSDAIALLNYFYRSGPPPAAPFPDPGADPEGEGSEGVGSLGCRKPIPIFEAVSRP